MRHRSARGLTAACCLAIAAACGGNDASPTPPPSTTPPTASAGTCAVPVEAPAIAPGAALAPKGDDVSDRAMRRARVYEHLWTHRAAAARQRQSGARPAPAAAVEDVG